MTALGRGNIAGVLVSSASTVTNTVNIPAGLSLASAGSVTSNNMAMEAPTTAVLLLQMPSGTYLVESSANTGTPAFGGSATTSSTHVVLDANGIIASLCPSTSVNTNVAFKVTNQSGATKVVTGCALLVPYKYQLGEEIITIAAPAQGVASSVTGDGTGSWSLTSQ